MPFLSLLLAPNLQGLESQILHEQNAQNCACSQSHLRHAPPQPSLPPSKNPESPEYKKYAPDRAVDFQHLTLEITPDFEKRSLQGRATFRLAPQQRPLEKLKLDAVDLSFSEISASVTGLSHHVTADGIQLHFSPPIAPGQPVEITLQYTAEPVQGLYFRTREMGYPETHLWTQGESIESRHWFPCFDHPIEKLTSEVICHVPKGMVALSNGRQIAVTPDPNGKTIAFRWLQEQPHSAYLITLVAGEFQKLEDAHRGIPLEFWTLQSDFTHAHNSFRNTRAMMEFFEQETGVPYPWAKYGQATIRDYHWGGMENTSLTTLNASTLFSEETEMIYSSDSLVAHELAHQWFGDLVTCKDWSHTWLNEGFATYYDWLWQGHDKGSHEHQLLLFNAAAGILANTNETRGIVWRKFELPAEMFNYLAYPKGAWVLHMLRHQLGETTFRKAIQAYLHRHAFQSVSTDQFRFALEEASGLSLERFFDQWVYGIGAPHLDIEHHWDESQRLLQISIRQTQKISEEAPLFQFPLPLRFHTREGVLHQTVEIRKKEETFFLKLPSAPEILRIDPEVSLLSKINFKMPRPMALALLRENQDPVGQILALNQLAEKTDLEAVRKIAETLQQASFFRVRQQAAETLRKAGTPEALTALLEAKSQKDPRVRVSVASALGGFLETQAFEGLRDWILSEKNPGVTAAALRSLAIHSTPEAKELLVRFLNTPCYKERMAEAALEAMRRQEDPGFVAPVLAALQTRSAHWPTSLTASALETIGHLHRNQLDRQRIQETLLPYLQNPKQRLRIAAIQGLGNLLDPRAIPTLESFSNLSPYRVEKDPADKALEKIRSSRLEPEEVKTLRSELHQLQTQGRELKKELEELQRKIKSPEPR